jgi:hypothetical protein
VSTAWELSVDVLSALGRVVSVTSTTTAPPSVVVGCNAQKIWLSNAQDPRDSRPFSPPRAVILLPRNAYDAAHAATRRRLLPKAYNTPCPRCGRLMRRGEALDLGHSEDLAVNPNSRADRIEHADCNRAAGGKLGHQRRQFKPSRAW